MPPNPLSNLICINLNKVYLIYREVSYPVQNYFIPKCPPPFEKDMRTFNDKVLLAF